MIRKEQIPNYLTYIRVIGILPVCWLMGIDQGWAGWCAFLLYTGLAITDYYDGKLARLWNVKSEIGRFLDPIADKLLMAAVIVMLVSQDVLWGWLLAMPILILMREIFISGLREFMGNKNVILHVTTVAKWKTTMQLVSIGVLMLVPALGAFAYFLGIGLLGLATFLTVFSGWQYWVLCLPYFKENK